MNFKLSYEGLRIAGAEVPFACVSASSDTPFHRTFPRFQDQDLRSCRRNEATQKNPSVKSPLRPWSATVHVSNSFRHKDQDRVGRILFSSSTYGRPPLTGRRRLRRRRNSVATAFKFPILRTRPSRGRRTATPTTPSIPTSPVKIPASSLPG